MATATDYSPEIYEDLPADQYHGGHSSISKSALWEFWQRRRLYQARYLLGTAPPKESTDAMDIGTLADAAILEPHRLQEMYAVMPSHLLSPDGGIRSNAAKAHRDELEAAGKIVLKQAQLDQICAIVESAQSKLGDWLKLPSRRQCSIYWTEPTTGLRCKCRPDWLVTPKSGGAFIFDLKTTADASPRAFARRCEEHGYWLQDAHYREGVQAATGEEAEFYFVVVETTFPFACCVQQLKPADVEKARSARLRALRQLHDCLQANDFREAWEGEVSMIDLRPWCFQNPSEGFEQ